MSLLSLLRRRCQCGWRGVCVEVEVGCCRRLGTDAARLGAGFTSQSRKSSCDQSKIP